MILDSTSLFSDGQAITATAVSTNALELGEDVGHGNFNHLLVQVVEAFNNLTSLKVTLQDSDDGASWADVIESGDIPLASLVAGHRVPFDKLPQKTRKHLRLNYTVTGTAPTAGKITAGFTPNLQQSYLNSQKLGGERTY